MDAPNLYLSLQKLRVYSSCSIPAMAPSRSPQRLSHLAIRYAIDSCSKRRRTIMGRVNTCCHLKRRTIHTHPSFLTRTLLWFHSKMFAKGVNKSCLRSSVVLLQQVRPVAYLLIRGKQVLCPLQSSSVGLSGHVKTSRTLAVGDVSKIEPCP